MTIREAPFGPGRRLWSGLRATRAARDAKCEICGTLVHRDDDAVGLVHNRLVHAECALLRWLNASGAGEAIEARVRDARLAALWEIVDQPSSDPSVTKKP
jgi:hypothetical protein